METRENYWYKMCRFRYQLNYLYLCYHHCILVNRIIQIGTAIASSTAIAAWVKWTNLSFIWGCIIVGSQVILAIYEVLPIKKRTESLSSLISQLDQLYLEVESVWQEINFDEKYTDENINKKIYDFEKKWSILINKTLADDLLPQSNRLREKAYVQAYSYIVNNLGGKAHNEVS